MFLIKWPVSGSIREVFLIKWTVRGSTRWVFLIKWPLRRSTKWVFLIKWPMSGNNKGGVFNKVASGKNYKVVLAKKWQLCEGKR